MYQRVNLQPKLSNRYPVCKLGDESIGQIQKNIILRES